MTELWLIKVLGATRELCAVVGREH
jgi:hypothetical protein